MIFTIFRGNFKNLRLDSRGHFILLWSSPALVSQTVIGPIIPNSKPNSHLPLVTKPTDATDVSFVGVVTDDGILRLHWLIVNQWKSTVSTVNDLIGWYHKEGAMDCYPIASFLHHCGNQCPFIQLLVGFQVTYDVIRLRSRLLQYCYSISYRLFLRCETFFQVLHSLVAM